MNKEDISRKFLHSLYCNAAAVLFNGELTVNLNFVLISKPLLVENMYPLLFL